MHRAFVLQLTPGCQPGNSFRGRVEHVRSGKAIHFDSLDQFLCFVARSLETESQPEAAEQ